MYTCTGLYGVKGQEHNTKLITLLNVTSQPPCMAFTDGKTAQISKKETV